MNLAVVAAVFPVIFLGELPDKTMFASLVMATRGRPFAVWLGATAAFAVHVVIATTVGVLLIDILPHRAVEVAVALTFFAGAGLASTKGCAAGTTRSRRIPRRAPCGGARSALTTFVVIFLAEWGDLTQVLTVNLAARYHSPWSVGTGALLAMAAVAGVAVAAGRACSGSSTSAWSGSSPRSCSLSWGVTPVGRLWRKSRPLCSGGMRGRNPEHFGQSLSRRGKWIIGVTGWRAGDLRGRRGVVRVASGQL